MCFGEFSGEKKGQRRPISNSLNFSTQSHTKAKMKVMSRQFLTWLAKKFESAIQLFIE